jgi:hypothetical protein
MADPLEIEMLGNHLKSLERGRGREMLSIKQLGLSRRSSKKKHDTALVVGNTHRGKDRMAGNARKKLRHRTHQYCASKPVEILNNKPLYDVKEIEAYPHQETRLARSLPRDIPPL